MKTIKKPRSDQEYEELVYYLYEFQTEEDFDNQNAKTLKKLQKILDYIKQYEIDNDLPSIFDDSDSEISESSQSSDESSSEESD